MLEHTCRSQKQFNNKDPYVYISILLFLLTNLCIFPTGTFLLGLVPNGLQYPRIAASVFTRLFGCLMCAFSCSVNKFWQIPAVFVCFVSFRLVAHGFVQYNYLLQAHLFSFCRTRVQNQHSHKATLLSLSPQQTQWRWSVDSQFQQYIVEIVFVHVRSTLSIRELGQT